LGYSERLKRVRECRHDIRRVFEQVDVLVLPTMRAPAPSIAETVAETHRRPPSNTSAFNHFGMPAMTVPCGFSKEGLPIGLQIVGAAFREPAVLQVAYAYQQGPSGTGGGRGVNVTRRAVARNRSGDGARRATRGR